MRPQHQLTLTFALPSDRAIRLCDVEIVLSKVISPGPSRTTLLNWIDEGKLIGKKMSFGWIVYESSLKRFIDSLQLDNIAAA